MTDENSTPAEEQTQQPAYQPEEQQAATGQPAAEQAQPAQAYAQPDPAQAQQAYQQAVPAYQQPMQGQPQQAYQPYQQPVQGQPQQAYQQPMQGQPQQAYQQPMQGQPQQAYQQPYQQPMQGQPQFYQQPPQGAYGQPPQQAWGQPPAHPKNKRAIAALVCGILAIVFSPSIIVGIALGVVALVLVLTPKGQPRDGKMKAGMICGIVGIALSVIMAIGFAVAYNAAVQEAQRQAAIEAARVPLYEQVEGTIIADDQVCTIKITKMEIDDVGDLDVYFTVTDNTPTGKSMDVSTVRSQAWEVNGQKVSCSCFTTVKPGETKEDFFYVPSSYLPVTNIEDVESVYGVLEVDPGTGIPMEYTVDLY